ncbi:MAG: processing protein [Pseudonocardiales bacterium]|nr:processing protein [Pseudonocardiales bacterium]
MREQQPPDEVLIARAYLSRVAEAGSLPVAQFVIDHGPVEAANLIRAGSAPDLVLAATAARQTRADGSADLAAAQRHQIRFVIPESPDWPQFAFAPLYAAQVRRLAAWSAGLRTPRYGAEPTVPIGLWIRGPLALDTLGLRSVAVVGARAATAYGEHVAVEFSYGLAGNEVTVVSGGAFGIDVCAHRGALAAGGSTVLVSAGGLDRPYPSAHSRLYEEVAESGLVVSESPPGCAPHRHRFLSRNRVIAALSSTTVVIEAALRSGALNTAAHCVSLGRPLLAVPGPVTSAMSAGCHALISRPDNPAQLVSSIDEILAVIGPVPVHDVLFNTDQVLPRNAYDDLDPTARVVLDGMPARKWAREDEIAARSGVAIGVVLQTLPVLRMGGYLEAGREGYRLIRKP